MIDRRRFLSGVGGAMVALPAINALLPRSAWAATDTKVCTFMMRNGNGVAQAGNGEGERFWPRNGGTLTQQSLGTTDSDRAVSELATYADSLLIINGTKHGFEHNNCGHAKGIVQCFTAANFTEHGEGRNTSSKARSLDWEISQRLNPAGVNPLNLRSGGINSYFGYDTAIYSGNGQKVDGETNPYAVYQRLFNLGTGSMDDTTQAALRDRRKSVNDLVRGEMNELLGKASLGSSDKSRLRKHFDAIRDLEIKITNGLDTAKVTAMEQIASNANANDNRLTVARMHMDIAALAFASDINRVATLQIGGTNDKTRYRVNGTLVDDFHWISHRVQSDGSAGAAIANAPALHHGIDRLFMQTFKYMLDQLKEHGVYDRSIAYWTNDLAAGPSHAGGRSTSQFIPQIVAGKAAGALRTGRYVNAGNVTHNKLLNTILAATGARNADGSTIDFGDASLAKGVLSDLLA